MHSVTNFKPELGHHPTIWALSTNMIRLQRWSTKGFKNLCTHTHFAVNGSLNSHPQMEILQVNRTTLKTLEPTASNNTLPLNCFIMRNELWSVSHNCLSQHNYVITMSSWFFKAFLHTWNLHCIISRNAVFALEKISRFLFMHKQDAFWVSHFSIESMSMKDWSSCQLTLGKAFLR